MLSFRECRKNDAFGNLVAARKVIVSQRDFAPQVGCGIATAVEAAQQHQAGCQGWAASVKTSWLAGRPALSASGSQ
jgi:hypothetical protein